MSTINSIGTNAARIAYQQKDRNKDIDSNQKETQKDGIDKQVSSSNEKNTQPTNLQIEDAVSKIDVTV